MIYVNEYTHEVFDTADECKKSENEYLEKKKKAEEKARADKAKREAEKKAKEEEENKKKEQIKEAYKKAIEAVDVATQATEEYLDLCKKLGYHVSGSFDFSPLMKLIFEL